MQFTDINFTERSGSKHSGLGLSVKGYWVSKHMMELAWNCATTQLSRLDWSIPQVAATLCGPDCWKSYAVGGHIALGRCIKFFVDNDMLPLQLANPGKKGTRKYSHKYISLNT